MGRWTILGSLGLIALIAVSFAAIRDASRVWAVCLPLIAGAAFVFGLARGILRRGSRAGWIAFAAPGFAYFTMAVLLSPLVGAIPLVSPLIDLASSRLEPPPPRVHEIWLPRDRWMELPLGERQARAIVLTQDSERVRQYTVAMKARRESFGIISQSLISLLIGAAGTVLFKTTSRLIRPPVVKSELTCP